MKKNLPLILNAVLAVAVIVLFILFFNQKKCNSSHQPILAMNGNDSTISFKLPIAYINIDSLLINYQYAKDANEALIKEQENSRLTINSRARQLQQEMAEFQRKLENNAFLSRQRAEDEQARLAKKQQELQELDGKLTQQLMQKQQAMSEALRDTINKFLVDYNKDNKYEIIFSNTSSDNILYSEKAYDITADIIAALNNRLSKK